MQEKSGKNKIYENAIKNWPKEERPREKLLEFGEHAGLTATASRSYSQKKLRRLGSRIFRVSRGVGEYPTHPKQSLCLGLSAYRVFTYLRSNLAFPLEEWSLLYKNNLV